MIFSNQFNDTPLKKRYSKLFSVNSKKILASKNTFADETPIALLSPGKGKTHQEYMWVLAGGEGPSPPYRTYHFRMNRKHCHIGDLLGEYDGVLHSDKYGAFEVLAKQGKIVWCPCWSHVRRKFVEAESGDPEFRRWILRKIRYLFLFERVAWNRSEEERLLVRKTNELPIIEEILEAVKNKLTSGKVLPKSNYRQNLTLPKKISC